MHFVNRENGTNPPTSILEGYNTQYKVAWVAYNVARANKIKPLPSRPPSSWLDNQIRIPLMNLFLKNCGYCGIYTVIGSDAEVDHFLPTSLDLAADHVFSWDNYVWACHSCNNMKNDNFPFLDPCSEDEMKHIYFHAYDGKYLHYSDAPDIVKEKFLNTEKYSNLNFKNRPDSRKYLFYELTEYHLNGLYRAHKIYEVELDIQGQESDDVKEKLQLYNQKKESFMNLVKCGDYLHLIKYALEYFCLEKQCRFPFTFESLIAEIDYFSC